MRAETCLQIKNLEDRLACLEVRYQELANTLAEERETGMISDEIGDLPHILAERAFVQKQIQITKRKIDTETKLKQNRKLHDTVGIGAHVQLENTDHNLDVYIVEDSEANPTRGYISDKSPIGKAIMGHVLGDHIDIDLPRGMTNYTIAGLR